ncbi:bacteriophage abortive infection AbiH family protein [Segatella copri]|uniref:bacteriophage abortive infection AbiH family protein n=1 Tax=Segatella copri TaxID=165179 RepID=UPI00222E9716|nr:bacteriophage abortive infection AbiH family protein [Segatella copri]MCW4087510.1 bacteriophage abortive infection AbiH family protein [Segatella copri]MCW4160361.1 bacteriophage abortive infection AbiH family protein [Segatella copri]
MAKKILIIGNGFDIDLGLRTRYSDFAKSNIWEKLMRNTYGFDQDLLAALREAKEKEAWFDIEKTMNEYVRAIRPESLTTDLVDKDKKNFIEVTKALDKYLKDEQKSRTLESNHYAAQVLRLIADVGGFEYYTFNYTSLGDIATSCGIKIDTSRITHVHGSLENDSIILGVLTDPANQLHEQYSFMYKDNSRFYMSNNMYEDFDKADDIIFFGHSINGMDFPYFKDFFIKQSGMGGEYKSKHITIFIYDDDSNQQIRNSIRNAQVDLTQLFRRNNISIIQTKQMYYDDRNELQKFEVFTERLNDIKASRMIVTMPNPNRHRNMW